MDPRTPQALGYVAGLIDGEGGFHLGFSYQPKMKAFRPSVSLTISNTDKSALEFAYEVLQVGRLYRYKHGRRKPIYVLNIGTPVEIIRVNQLMADLLIIKKRQLELAAAFARKMLCCPEPLNLYLEKENPKEIIELFRELYQIYKEFKKYVSRRGRNRKYSVKFPLEEDG